jgi:hypothetical protein
MSRKQNKVDAIRRRWLNKQWPCWFGEPAYHGGPNVSTILEVRPYTGPYDFIACIFKLTAPNTRRGWMEMSIEHINLRHAEAAPADDANEEIQRIEHDRHNHLPIER